MTEEDIRKMEEVQKEEGQRGDTYGGGKEGRRKVEEREMRPRWSVARSEVREEAGVAT